MKIRLGLLFTIVSSLYVFCCGETFKIGAIFDTTDKEYRENALKFAVAKFNSESSEHKLEYELAEVEMNETHDALLATCSLIEKGVVAILGPSSEDNSNVVQSVCDEKDIPHLDIRWDDQPLKHVVNIHPYQGVLTELYGEILKKYKHDDFVILYEDNDGLQRVGELIKLYSQKHKHNKIIIKKLDKHGTGDFREQLKGVWRTGAKVFVLDCNIGSLQMVLTQAQQIGLMTNQHTYIVTNLDFHTENLEPFQYSETNITGLRFFNPIMSNISEVSQAVYAGEPKILLLDHALIVDAIAMLGESLKAAPTNFTAPSLSCDSWRSWSFGTTMVNLIKGMRFRGITGLIQFDTFGLRSNFGLEVIGLMDGGIVQVGNWSTNEQLNISWPPPPDLAGSKSDDSLKNKTFTILAYELKPYVMKTESTSPLYGNEQYEGFCVDLIKELSELTGFNYTFQLRLDSKTGEANGTHPDGRPRWNGMIGDIMDSDNPYILAVGDVTITSIRHEVVDFTTPIMTLGISILFEEPNKAPPGFFSFADPFALEVWKFIAAAFVGVSILLWIIGRICPEEWQNPYPCVEEPEHLINLLTLQNCFWFITGAIMQQGSEIAPIAISTRMISGMWWFFTLLMVSSYTANLAAFLTLENDFIKFHNVEELVKVAEQGVIKYGAKTGGATASFFNTSQKPLFKKIAKYMSQHEKEVMVSSNDEGVAKAVKGDYAFFMEITGIEYETQRKCNLTFVGPNLDEKGYGIAMKKNSTFRNVLSTAVLHLQETGKLADLKRKWWEEQRGGGQCPKDDEESAAKPLNLDNVLGVFLVTIGGTILSIFCVFVEFLTYIFQRSRKTKIPFKELLIEELKFSFISSSMVKPVSYDKSSGEGSSKDSKDVDEAKDDKKSKSTKESGDIPSGNGKADETVPYGYVLGNESRERLT